MGSYGASSGGGKGGISPPPLPQNARVQPREGTGWQERLASAQYSPPIYDNVSITLPSSGVEASRSRIVPPNLSKFDNPPAIMPGRPPLRNYGAIRDYYTTLLTGGDGEAESSSLGLGNLGDIGVGGTSGLA